MDARTRIHYTNCKACMEEPMITLTDQDRAAILEASGYDRLTDRGQIMYEAIYRAGMAAMAERAAEIPESVGRPDLAAAIRALVK